MNSSNQSINEVRESCTFNQAPKTLDPTFPGKWKPFFELIFLLKMYSLQVKAELT